METRTSTEGLSGMSNKLDSRAQRAILYDSRAMKSFAVANCVGELRRAAGVTQEALAEAVGVTRQTVIAVEGGNYTPSVLLALRIARFFRRPLEDIFLLTRYGK